MRTKESIDRETKELQERTWIYMLHHQAPPLTRHATPATPLDAHAPSGFIPLAPMASHTPSPLVAARAAAASLALHVNANALNTAHNGAGSGTWAAQSHPPPSLHARTPREHTVRPSDRANVFGSMVKLEKTHQQPLSSTPTFVAAANRKPMPLPSVFSPHSSLSSSSAVFRSIISKPAVPEAPTPSAHVQRTPGGGGGMNSLMGMLSKRPRDEEFLDNSFQPRNRVTDADADEEYDEEYGMDGDYGRANGSKRPCLPKKCDFPMCKNSSRSRGFCYSHGGGRRCRVDNCANGAVSRDLCKRHGGGRRCRVDGCKSSSESGGLCYSHGGGRRCNLSWCNARAKKGGYCAAHVDNRNALPPVDVVVNEREREADDLAATKGPVKIAAKPTETAVNPLVIETLLSLSKSPSQSDTEDNCGPSPTSSAAAVDLLLSPRLSNPYAIASILN